MAKVQMNITEDFESQILSTAEYLGMSKNEFIKYSIQSVMVSLKQSQEAIKSVATEYARKEDIIG